MAIAMQLQNGSVHKMSVVPRTAYLTVYKVQAVLMACIK